MYVMLGGYGLVMGSMPCGTDKTNKSAAPGKGVHSKYQKALALRKSRSKTSDER